MTLESDVVMDPPVVDSLKSDITDSQCNLEAKCSQPKTKNRKRRKKHKDAPMDNHVDTSTLKDDSSGTNSCHDSLVEISAKTEFKATLPVLSRSKRKRKKKKQKSSSSMITDEAHVSLADLDLTGTEENALISEKQRDPPISPSASIVCKHDGESTLSLVEKENIKKKRKPKRNRHKPHTSAINDSAHNPHADLDVIGTEGNDLLSEKLSDPRSPSVDMVEKHDNNGEDAFISDGNENIKKIRKGDKQKLNTSVMTDKVHVPSAVLDIIEVDKNASISLKQSDSSGTSSTTVNKHNHSNLASAFGLDERENIQKKREKKKQKLNTSVITDKVHVPLAELDRPKEANTLIYVEQIDSQSTPSSNQGAVCILVEKENTESNCIEGNLKPNRRKRRKSSDSEEVMEPTTVAGQASSDSDKVHLTKISNNEVKRVQAGKVAASVNVVRNVLAENTTSDCSNVVFACPKSKDQVETKTSTGLNVSVEKLNFQQVAHPLVGAHVGCADKKLLILDVNGLLVDIVPFCQRGYKADIVISKKYVFKRPFCDDFLQFCFEKFNVGVWSSRVKYFSTHKRNVDLVVDFLMADSRHKLLFCWDQSHCTETGFQTPQNNSKPLVLKELKKLWDKLEPGLPWNKGDYNESNTLLLDDSPYKALRNPENTAIFPYSYDYRNPRDSSLGPGGKLRVYLEKLVEAQNVQEYVAHNPFGQHAITESNPGWGFYQKIVRNESGVTIASTSGPSLPPQS